MLLQKRVINLHLLFEFASIAKGGAKLTNKIGNKTLNRVSNKMVQSKNAITKSVKKLPVSTKTARNAATKIQSVKKMQLKQLEILQVQ
jgi:hypothetical protein